MPSPHARAGFRAVIALPGAARPLLCATVGRLSYAMVPLTLLLTTQHATGSLAAGGGVLAAFGASSASAPWKSRLVDRLGQRRVLPPLGLAYAAVLLSCAAWAAAGGGSLEVYAVLAVLAGLSAPPLGPSMRAQWALLTASNGLRSAAYSLDAVTEETAFVVGPVIAAATVVTFGAPASLVLVAVLILLGAVGLGTSQMAKTTASTAARRPEERFRLRGQRFLGLLGAITAVGLALGALEIGVVARTTQEGRVATAGPLLAALSLGGVVDGLLWGRRRAVREGHEVPAAYASLRLLLIALASGLALTGLTPGLWSMGALLVLTGVAVTPAYVVTYLLADSSVPESGRTEAGTWVSTASNVGAAAGTAGSGFAVAHVPVGTVLLGAAGVVLLSVWGTQDGSGHGKGSRARSRSSAYALTWRRTARRRPRR